MPGPLDGLRVIDVGTRIGAPFCAGLLGEWGAEVVKVEQPGTGDFMRTIGPFVDGYSLFWAVEGRGRKSATCDLRTPEGQDLFRRLAATADVVCENFRPGTLEDWGLGPDGLDPQLVFVRISAFGQDGPYAGEAGARPPGRGLRGPAPPDRRGRPAPGAPRRDRGRLPHRGLRGRGGPGRAVPARRHAQGRRTGDQGAVVDASLYGSVLRILEWTIPAYDRLGHGPDPRGQPPVELGPARQLPHGRRELRVRGGRRRRQLRRLCGAMDRPDLLEDPRFATLADRARHGDTINAMVAAVDLRAMTAAEVERACIAHDVPVATAYNARDIALDPHFAARHDLVAVDDPVLGSRCASRRRTRGWWARPAPPGGAPRTRRPQPRGVVRPGRPGAVRARGSAGQGDRVSTRFPVSTERGSFVMTRIGSGPAPVTAPGSHDRCGAVDVRALVFGAAPAPDEARPQPTDDLERMLAVAPVRAPHRRGRPPAAARLGGDQADPVGDLRIRRQARPGRLRRG